MTTVRELELKKNMIFKEATEDFLDSDMDERTFKDHIYKGDLVAVGVEDRTQWLKDNGYEVTRANLVNVDLPTNLEKL